MDYRLLLMTGADYPIPECNLILHQPNLFEISLLGEENFFIGIQTLTLYKEMFITKEQSLQDITNFQIFITIMTAPETIDKKEIVEQILLLLLPTKKVKFTPQSLLLMENNEIITIDEHNFEYLQEALRSVFCLKTGPMDTSNFNPVNDQAKKIAHKLMRGREKIQAEKGNEKSSVLGQYISILSVGLHLSISVLNSYTIYQIYNSIERFSLYLDWDLDVKTRLAGGKPDRAVDNWMKNLN